MAEQGTACVVGESMRVQGTLQGSGDVEVRGQVHGRVALADHLWVAQGGSVDAELEAGRATIDGRLRGRLRIGGGGIELRAGADVVGELQTPSLSLSPEASFDGELDMPVSLPAALGGG